MSLAGSALDLHLKSVLVATDLSPASVKPLYEALAIARHYDAKVYVAHVVSPLPYLMAGPEALELACEGASHELQQLQRDLLRDGSMQGLDREFIIHYGTVWEELQAVILHKQVDLVVVGTHGRRGIEKVLLGSVAEQVFRDASCSVLTVGPHSYQDRRADLHGEVRTYLFATDFSEASLRALPLARLLAHQTKGRLILLHVVPAAPAPQLPGWYNASEITAMRENARMTCVRQLEQLVSCDEETPIDAEFVV
jgi:nucleotide-binding universal stress UspA family protein